MDDSRDVCGSGWVRCRVGLPDGYVEAKVSEMIERDIKAIIRWFKEYIEALEVSEYFAAIRVGVNRLVGFVEVLEGELDGITAA